VEDGSGIQDGLHIPEGLLYLPEFLILAGHPFGTKAGVGPKDPLAVEA
jgi:hypothetical protein